MLFSPYFFKGSYKIPHRTKRGLATAIHQNKLKFIDEKKIRLLFVDEKEIRLLRKIKELGLGARPNNKTYGDR